MRVLLFHGYLLSGTGSNVYTANLARALARLGHEVHLLCQDRGAAALPWVDRTVDWDDGVARVRTGAGAAAPRVTVYRPAIGPLLPVYVADAYEGIEARPFPELTDAEVERYVAGNVDAVRGVVRMTPIDLALAGHLVMGPLVLARALHGSGVPYAVKIHGSALEYAVVPHPERFLAPAREGIAGARGVLVGSRHTAERLWTTIADPALPARTRLGPPGVDVAGFAPREHADARAGLERLSARLAALRPDPPSAASSFARVPGEAWRALAAIGADDRLVVYVGKLIAAKGVELLLAAWPRVVAAVPEARLVVVGFGGFRGGLEQLAAALGEEDRAAARAIAEAGAALEGGPRRPLAELQRWLDACASGAAPASGPAPGPPAIASPAARLHARAPAGARHALAHRAAFAGRLDHDELGDLLPVADALVMPSTFPEAFGMVAAEAAACGALPIVAEHSGMAEVSRSLAGAVPPEARGWLSFTLGGERPAVDQLAERLIAWLTAPEALRAATRAAIVEATRERWSWEGVARGVLDAASGRLGNLPEP